MSECRVEVNDFHASPGIIRSTLRAVVRYGGREWISKFLGLSTSRSVDRMFEAIERGEVPKDCVNYFVDNFFVYSFSSPRVSIYLFELSNPIEPTRVLDRIMSTDMKKYLNKLRKPNSITLRGRPELVCIYSPIDQSYVIAIYVDRGQVREYVDSKGKIHRSYTLQKHVIIVRRCEYVEVRTTASHRKAEAVLRHFLSDIGEGQQVRRVTFHDTEFAMKMIDSVNALGYLSLEFSGYSPYGRVSFTARKTGNRRSDLRNIEEVKRKIYEAVMHGFITRIHGYVEFRKKPIEVEVGGRKIAIDVGVSFGINFRQSKIYFFDATPLIAQKHVMDIILDARRGVVPYALPTRTLLDYIRSRPG